MIFDNETRRSFEAADVNTVIALFSATDEQKTTSLDTTARFVMVTAPFDHILSAVIFEEIEDANIRRVTQEYRVVPIQQSMLLADGFWPPISEANPIEAPYTGNKWGSKYLRMPEVLSHIMSSRPAMFTPLPSVVDYTYGIKPGDVNFFYVTPAAISKFGIEQRYLAPLVNSSQTMQSIYIAPDAWLFWCRESKEELRGTGALKYILHGEGNGVQDKTSVRSHRPYWYTLNGSPFDFIIFVFWDKRFWTPIASSRCYASNNFFCGICSNSEDRDAILPQLQSTLYFLQIETYGRKNQGQGVLNTYGPDFRYPRLISPDSLGDEDPVALCNALEGLADKPVQPIYLDILTPEKKHLDAILFDTLRLTQGERDSVYEAMIHLVNARLQRSESLRASNNR